MVPQISWEATKLIYGRPYADYKQHIKPLDIILFRGGDLASSTIRYIEKKRDGRGDFSHSGIIVTTDVLDHPDMKPGRLYILESTVTGWLGCGVKNIEGKAAFCVQITDFSKLVEAYDSQKLTGLAVFHLDAPLPVDVKPKLQAFWEGIRGRSYQFDILSLLTCAFPFLRGDRRQIEEIFGGKNWVFCSQLVCMALQAVGVVSSAIDPKDIMPVDFLGGSDHEMPCVVSNPREPVYLLNKYWARKQARFPLAESQDPPLW